MFIHDKNKIHSFFLSCKVCYILETNLKTIWQKGKPVDVILETCKNQQIDLLILGALQQEKLYNYYVGSIARKITRKAPCSILLLIKPSIVRVACKHIVVNGLEDKKTEETIKTAFIVSDYLNCKKITIVEEIKQEDIQISVNDDISLRRANIARERIATREDRRVKKILNEIDYSVKEAILLDIMQKLKEPIY